MTKMKKEWTSQSLHMQEGSNREGWREIVKKATDVEPCLLMMMMMMERLYLSVRLHLIFDYLHCANRAAMSLQQRTHPKNLSFQLNDQKRYMNLIISIIAMLPAAFHIKSRGDRRCINFLYFQMWLSTRD